MRTKCVMNYILSSARFFLDVSLPSHTSLMVYIDIYYSEFHGSVQEYLLASVAHDRTWIISVGPLSRTALLLLLSSLSLKSLMRLIFPLVLHLGESSVISAIFFHIDILELYD